MEVDQLAMFLVCFLKFKSIVLIPIHTSNIIWTEKHIFKNIFRYVHIKETRVTEKKEATNLKKNKDMIMEGFGRKGKGER